jgi:hypothetical protein
MTTLTPAPKPAVAEASVEEILETVVAVEPAYKPDATGQKTLKGLPCDWSLVDLGDDQIEAISRDGETFIGTRKEFSAALQGN